MHEKDPTLIEALFGLALVDDSNRELWLKRSIEADSSNAAFFFLAAAEKVRIGVDTEQVLELIGKGARCTRFELPGSFLLFRKHQCFANLSAQHKAYLQMSITLSNNAYSLLRMLDDKYIKPTIVDNDRSSELQKYYASRFYQLVSCSEPRTAMLFIFGRQRLMKSSTALGILDADEQRYRNDLSEMQTLDTGSHVPVMEYLSTCCLGTR
jgi:hypothetical protein